MWVEEKPDDMWELLEDPDVEHRIVDLDACEIYNVDDLCVAEIKKGIETAKKNGTVRIFGKKGVKNEKRSD